MTTLEQILTYYADKLIAQYRDQPNARGTVEIFGKQIIADDLATQLGLSFSIETAVGPQLDILGKYIGISRNIGETLPDTNTYFAFTSYTVGNDSECGFSDYTDLFINAGGLFYLYQYGEGIPSDLTDDQYRVALKLQIAVNASDGTLNSIQNIMAEFPEEVLTIDAKDMNLVYALAAFPTVLPLTVLRRLLPRPMTLGLSVVVTSPIQRCLDDGVTLRCTDSGAIRALIAG